MLFQFETLELDTLRFELRRAGVLVPVPRLVFDLIVYLLVHRDRPVSKGELFEHVWPGRKVTEASLSQAITAARRALRDSPVEQRVIKTVHGRGYWWVADTWIGARTDNLRRPDPFVGRSLDLALAVEGLEGVTRGTSLLIRVIGEAGIGKTRFANEVAVSAKGLGFQVFRGRCAETSGEATHSPWHDVMTQVLLPAESSEDIRAAASKTRLDLIDQIPVALRPHVRAQPTLVILDDVHRMDRLSIRLAYSTLREFSQLPLALLLTYRDPLASPVQEAIDELARAAPCRTVELAPLGLSETRELVRGLTHGPSSPDPILLYERSEGNPFFVTELIHAFEAEGCEPERRRGDLPTTIRDAVNDQTSRLSSGSIALIRAASVIGREFEASLLGELTDRPVSPVLELIDELLSRRLVESAPDRPGVFRFRHLLVRDAVYAQLPVAERSRLHLAVAAAIVSRNGQEPGPHLLPLAHHMRSALPVASPADVAETSLRAARYATQSLEPEAAVECCREALELLQNLGLSTESRVNLSIALAVAEMKCGLRKEGRRTLEKLRLNASVAAEPELVARAALSLAPGFFAIETGVVDWDLIATVEEALGSLPVRDSVARVRLLGSLAQALYWSEDRTRVEALVRDASAAATRLASPSGLAYAALAQFGALWGPGNLTARRDLSGRLRLMCRTVGDAELEMMSSVFTLATLLEIGDRRRAKTQAEGLRRIALNNDCVHGRWFPPMYEAMFAIATGRFSDAEALIRAYHSIGQRLDDVNVTQTCLLQMTEILWQTGRAAAVVGPVEENIEKHPALHEWQGALVFLNARAGRLGEARKGLAALAGRDLPGLSYRMNAVIGVSALVEAAWILEDPDAAAKLLRVVERWGERLVVAGYGVLVWGSTARLRGHLASLLGELEEAEAWYRRALSVERRERNCVWRARTQLAYARLLRLRSMRGDRRKASRLVSQAQRFAEMRGLSSLAEEAAALAGRRS